MNDRWKLTKESKKQLVSDFNNGSKPSQIAQKYNIQGSTVYYHLQRAGVWKSQKKEKQVKDYIDYVEIAIDKMEVKLKTVRDEDRRMIIKDTIQRYKLAKKNYNLCKNSSVIIISDEIG